MTDQQVARLARLMVIVLTLGALFLAIYTSVSLMGLLLMAFAGVGQIFPGVVLGLFSKRVTAAGVFSGMIAGVALSVLLMLTGRDPYHGLAAGFIGLCLNLAIAGIATACTRVKLSGFEQPGVVVAAAHESTRAWQS